MFSILSPDSDSDTPIRTQRNPQTHPRPLQHLPSPHSESTPCPTSPTSYRQQTNTTSNPLARTKFLVNEPLRVYAIASRFGAHDTAALAAQHVLRYPLLHAEYFPELELVNGGSIYHILHYHKQCLAAALKVATDHTWIREGSYVFINCPGADSETDLEDDLNGLEAITTIRTRRSNRHKNGYPKSVSVHRWWSKFMATTKVALSESIAAETIRDKGRKTEARSSASQCGHCRKRVRSDFAQFLDAFVNEVEERTNDIKLVQPGVDLSWG